jgi:hypothetical protein
MVDKIIDISDFKKSKEKKHLVEKSEKVIEELSTILYIINLTITGLSHFNKYFVVTECISVLQNNKILLEIHINKYKKALQKIKEEMKNGKLEEASKEDTE